MTDEKPEKRRSSAATRFEEEYRLRTALAKARELEKLLQAAALEGGHIPRKLEEVRREISSLEARLPKHRVRQFCIVLALFSGTGLILLAVVPQFEAMYAEMQRSPATFSTETLLLLAASHWLRRYWFLAAPAVLGLSFLSSRISCRRQRLLAVTVIVLAVAVLVFMVIALFLPMVGRPMMSVIEPPSAPLPVESGC